MYCVKCGIRYEGVCCPKCGTVSPLKSSNLSAFRNNSLKKLALFSVGGLCLFLGLPFSTSLLAPPGLENLPLFIVGMTFVVAAVFCFFVAFHIIRRERKFNQYAALIGVRKKMPLSWISQKMNKPVSSVVKDLRKAISYGLFSEAHIDEEHGNLLFPNRNLGAIETVICPNCGAGVDIMVGYQSNCSFCGAVLKQD